MTDYLLNCYEEMYGKNSLEDTQRSREKYYTAIPTINYVASKYNLKPLIPIWSDEIKAYIIPVTGIDNNISGRIFIKQDAISLDFVDKDNLDLFAQNEVQNFVRVSGEDVCGVLNDVCDDNVVSTEFLLDGFKDNNDNFIAYDTDEGIEKMNEILFFHDAKKNKFSRVK